MALLPQTADRGVAVFFPASAVYAPTPIGAGPDVYVRLQWAPATVAIGMPWTGSTGAKKWALPLSIIAPLAVWQGQTSWPINMNIKVGFGFLAIPPSGSKRVSGVFQDQSGVGIARTGWLLDRATGAFLTSFSSAPVTGAWDGYVPTVNPVVAVLLPSGGDSRNAVVLDNLVPV